MQETSQAFSDAAEQVSLFCRLASTTKIKLPIRSSEMGMLIYLCTQAKHSTTTTPMDVASYFKVTKSHVTNMATSLSAQGYIVKKPSTTDRRSVDLIPTAMAQALVESTYTDYHRTMLELSQGLGSERFAQLITLVTDANTILSEGKAHE